MRTLHLSDDTADRLRHYLDTDRERMAFLLATADPAGTWVVTDEQYLDDATDYEYQGPYGMELADNVRPQVITWAHQHNAALIEAHAHLLPPPTGFSPTDLDGLTDAVPHLLWRLPGRPYTALVFGIDDLDALTWDAADQPRPLDLVELGITRITPTGIGATALTRRVRR